LILAQAFVIGAARGFWAGKYDYVNIWVEAMDFSELGTWEQGI
jgi:hypothetical protein